MRSLISISHLSESDSENKSMSLSSMIKQSWMKRTQLLDHDFAITGWALSILPEICDDVRLNFCDDKRMAIEQFIAKFHVAPNPKFNVVNNEIDMIIDIFWKENWKFSE